MNIFQRYIFINIFFYFFACANPGIPSGGPKDTASPIVRKTLPANYSLNFNQQKITLTFDEYIQVNNVKENLLISPPQKKKPTIKVKGKAIEITFVDSLHFNTTYVLDLGKAIVDLNEKLPLKDYRFVFSTGDFIDSLGLAGKIRKAFDHSIPENTVVCLFAYEENQNLYNKFPNYVTNIDSAGNYLFTNIADKSYKLIGLQDDNKNTQIDKGEPLAFLDSVVVPSKLLSVPSKPNDTSILEKYSTIGYLPDYLNLFKEEITRQYLKNYDRTQKSRLKFEFNVPREDTLTIDFIGLEEEQDWYLLERSATNDTLIYWIKDSSIYNQEKLKTALQYLKTDSLGSLNVKKDTVNLTFKTKIPKKSKKRKPVKKWLEITTNLSEDVNLSQRLFIEFNEPVVKLPEQSVKLFHLQNGKEKPLPAKLLPDTLKAHRKYWLSAYFLPGESYQILIDSAALTSIYGLQNLAYEKSFSLREVSYYGNIFVTLANMEETIILQLISADKNALSYEQSLPTSKVVSFTHVLPGAYILKAIIDNNKDDRWTSGNFVENRQPEEVLFYKDTIELKFNWDISISWNLHQ